VFPYPLVCQQPRWVCTIGCCREDLRIAALVQEELRLQGMGQSSIALHMCCLDSVPPHLYSSTDTETEPRAAYQKFLNDYPGAITKTHLHLIFSDNFQGILRPGHPSADRETYADYMGGWIDVALRYERDLSPDYRAANARS